MAPGDPTIASFIDYLAPFLVPTNIQQLLQPTDVVGNIRFTHPTLYVFPGMLLSSPLVPKFHLINKKIFNLQVVKEMLLYLVLMVSTC